MAVIIFVCYANIVQSPFLWDDEEMVINNPLIREWKYVKNIFTASAFGNKLTEGKFYRPLQILTYLFDYQIWGLNSIGYHVTNIFIHIINAVLVLLLLNYLGFSSLLALLGAAVFAVHPVGIEAITYISGRGDLLCVGFALACFNLFLIGSKKNKSYLFVAAFICYLASILSKENTLFLPIILSVYLLLYKKQYKQIANLLFLGSINLIMVSYIVFRLFFINLSKSAALSLIASASYYERFLSIPKALVIYLKIFFFPINLHMEYHFVEKSLFSPFIWLGIPFLAAFFFLLIKLSKDKLLSIFGAAMLFLGLAIVLNIPMPLPSTVREHWLYFPQIGLIIMLLLIIPSRLSKKNKDYIIYAFVAILALFGICTIMRNRDWRSPIILYEHDLQLEPKSFVLHNNLGVELFRLKFYSQAKKSFINSIETSPGKGYGTAYNNLAVILEEEDNLDQAVKLLKESINSSNYYLAYINIGRIYIKLNKPQLAITILKKGLKDYPMNIDIKYYLGVAYYFLNDIGGLNSVLQLMPPTGPEYIQLKNLAKKIKK
ncbi:hypothetical protein ACFLZV_01225 [Candidatus Margulisiibacteriota bacterium]